MTYADDLFDDEIRNQPVEETPVQPADETPVQPADETSDQPADAEADSAASPAEEPEPEAAGSSSEESSSPEDEVPEDVESTPDEVSLEDVEISTDIPLSDSEELAYKLLKRASQLKGVSIPRAAFLRGELSRRCDQETVDTAIASTPREAGVPLDTVDELADAVIALEAGKVAGLSALAGIPGGLLALGTIPADILQFVAHALRTGQELAYLYGWPTLADDKGVIDDDALYGLTLMLGSAMQVEGSSLTLARIADDVSEAGTGESLRQLLGDEEWHQPLKKVFAAVGTTITKGTFIEVVSRGIPLLSGIIAGGMTYATFRPGATALKRLLRALPQATGEIMPEEQMTELIAQIEEDARTALDASLRSALESAGEKAGAFVSQMGDAADDLVDSVGEAATTVAEQASAAASMMADKAAEYAAATRDKAVDLAKSMAIGFIQGLGTSKRDKRRKKEQKAAEEAAPAPEPAAPAAPANDYAQELRLLKALMDDGIITPEEFEAKKRQLLGL